MLPEVPQPSAIQGDYREEILHRLRTIQGHQQAVIAMVEAGEPCEAVLHQLCAVQAALGSAGRVLIRCRAEQCVSIVLNETCEEKRTESLLELIHLYQFLVKTEPFSIEVIK